MVFRVEFYAVVVLVCVFSAILVVALIRWLVETVGDLAFGVRGQRRACKGNRQVVTRAGSGGGRRGRRL
jgi:hypothetical protein